MNPSNSPDKFHNLVWTCLVKIGSLNDEEYIGFYCLDGKIVRTAGELRSILGFLRFGEEATQIYLNSFKRSYWIKNLQMIIQNLEKD